MKRRGFTLLELMVAAAVASVLMVGMLGVYSSGITALDQAGGRIELQSQCRFTLERITPFLSSAVPDTTTGAALATLSSYQIGFYSNDDFLRVPATAFDPRAASPKAPHYYILGQLTANNYNVVLQEPASPSWPAPTPTPLVISRARGLASGTVAVSFQRDTSLNNVWVTAQGTRSGVRRARRDQRTITYTMQTAVSIPAMLKN